MKILTLCFAFFVISGCAVLQNDSWAWLEYPDLQHWKAVSIYSGRSEVRFSVPDREGTLGDGTKFWPALNGLNDHLIIDIDLDSLDESYLWIGQVRWDEYLGGILEKEQDFQLDIWVLQFENESRLTNLSIDERIQRQISYYQKQYIDPESPWSKLFFENYWVKGFVNQKGIEIVVENQPQLADSQQFFYFPISDNHELRFTFFVRDKRWGWKEDPQWNQSRWDLVYQIMDTVVITPAN